MYQATQGPDQLNAIDFSLARWLTLSRRCNDQYVKNMGVYHVSQERVPRSLEM